MGGGGGGGWASYVDLVAELDLVLELLLTYCSQSAIVLYSAVLGEYLSCSPTQIIDHLAFLAFAIHLDIHYISLNIHTRNYTFSDI